MFQRDSISQLVASGLYNRLKCFQWTINAKSAIPDLQPLKSLYIQLPFQFALRTPRTQHSSNLKLQVNTSGDREVYTQISLYWTNT